jgi:hypothetical protein
MASAYWEELGGTATDPPPRTTAAPQLRHHWKLLGQQHGVYKHRCDNCGAIRTRITQADRFPITRYVTPSGQHSEKAPPCPRLA